MQNNDLQDLKDLRRKILELNRANLELKLSEDALEKLRNEEDAVNISKPRKPEFVNKSGRYREILFEKREKSLKRRILFIEIILFLCNLALFVFMNILTYKNNAVLTGILREAYDDGFMVFAVIAGIVFIGFEIYLLMNISDRVRTKHFTLN